ncbi:ankyrin repeat-containing domain protein [Baffinella frigidus]|nr:ankyrin repeat-containing domain protein [Cryptophyta sp. CCMP2293]
MPRRTAAIQQPPLWFAASKGDIQQARALVLSGVNIEEVGGRAPFRETPLETAVEEGYFEMAQMLLDNGADIHSRNVTDGGSLLHGTVKHSSTGMALLLINNGADVSALDDNGQTPLHRVAQTHFGRHPMYRDLGMVAARLLLDHGAHVSAIDNFGRTPLHWAALHGYTPVVRQLLESGADVSITDNEGATAVASGSVGQAEDLIAAGANLEQLGGGGGRPYCSETPLQMAVENGHCELAQLLLDNGANMNVRNVTDGGTPLHSAVKQVSDHMTILLLWNGADVSARDDYGETPLHRVASTYWGTGPWCRNIGASTAQLLIDNNARVSVRDKHGKTPLHLAAYYDHAPVVQVLLANGADDLVCDDGGVTAADLFTRMASETHAQSQHELLREQHARWVDRVEFGKRHRMTPGWAHRRE